MTTEERISIIETAARGDLARILAEPEPQRPDSGPGYANRVQRYAEARARWESTRADADDGIVRIELARWLGRPVTHSDTTLFSRAYAAGEEAGRWVRVQSSGRTWALQLTDPGERIARDLIATTARP